MPTLIDKTKKRMGSWTVKKLSYARIRVLLSTGIARLITFWSSVFLLPKYTTHMIESMCSSLLWSRTGNRKLYLIGWKNMCQPLSQKGLNFKELLAWNKVL